MASYINNLAKNHPALILEYKTTMMINALRANNWIEAQKLYEEIGKMGRQV